MSFTPKPQEIYRHFKGNLYQIITTAEHTETGETLVIYQALYGSFQIYARPLSMFTQQVDLEKYPQCKQKYRFELQQSTKQEETVKNTKEQSTKREETLESTRRQPAKKTETVQDITEQEVQLDPLLLQFLDADTYEERLNILAALHHRITDDMITTMAVASDIEVPGGDMETRYTELKNCLLMLEKYETSRLH